jgi:hypothetical protein
MEKTEILQVAELIRTGFVPLDKVTEWNPLLDAASDRTKDDELATARECAALVAPISQAAADAILRRYDTEAR